MKGRRKYAAVTVVILSLLVLLAAPTVWAGGKIITIDEKEINPGKLTVNHGDTVIWLNGNKAGTERGNPTISISFANGIEASNACVAHVNFSLQEKEFKSTKNLVPGETASLCFQKKGTYKYTINTPTKQLMGTIEVK